MDVPVRVFRFTEGGYWDSQGCSCCEPTWTGVYNSDDTDPNLGSAFDEEDCYMQAIRTALPELSEDETTKLYSSTYAELRKLCRDLNIEVVINEN